MAGNAQKALMSCLAILMQVFPVQEYLKRVATAKKPELCRYRIIVPWNVLSYHYGEYIHDPECEEGKMKELFDYLVTRGFEPDSFKVATFRTNDDPKDCKVEIWGELPGCDGETCPEVSFNGDEDPAWPGITAVPNCSPQACPILRCFKPEDIEVDVMDQWQAEQIGGTWSDEECPQACCPDETDCDESVLVPVDEFKESAEANPDALDV